MSFFLMKNITMEFLQRIIQVGDMKQRYLSIAAIEMARIVQETWPKKRLEGLVGLMGDVYNKFSPTWEVMGILKSPETDITTLPAFSWPLENITMVRDSKRDDWVIILDRGRRLLRTVNRSRISATEFRSVVIASGEGNIGMFLPLDGTRTEAFRSFMEHPKDADGLLALGGAPR